MNDFRAVYDKLAGIVSSGGMLILHHSECRLLMLSLDEAREILADADASQHWQTRALRAESALEQERSKVRALCKSGTALVGGAKNLLPGVDFPMELSRQAFDNFRAAISAAGATEPEVRP